MKNLKIVGKYTNAVIYAGDCEDDCISQIYELINNPAFKDQTVRLMPDVHVGSTGPCGLVSTIGDYMCPNHIGVDIGCSVSMLELSDTIPEDKYPIFEKRVKESIPMGPELHKKTVIDYKDFYKFLSNKFSQAKAVWSEVLEDLPSTVNEKWVDGVLKRISMEASTFYKSLGTIGGGNHFIEYDESEDKTIPAITMHFGSRNFGKKVCTYWMKFTTQPLSKNEAKELEKSLKDEYKRSHKNMDGFKDYLKKQISDARHDFLKGYLYGDKLKGYLCDMVFAQAYAEYNHIQVEKIFSNLLKKFNIKVVDKIFCTHNYIDMTNHLLRKSAISAKQGEKVLIPLNMRDGVLICEGLGNEDWLNSCSHGAGRKMSRNKAKQTISLDEFKKSMNGIYSTSVSKDTIDESPMAYKDSNEIIEQITESVKIINRVYPKISWKHAK